MSGAPDSLRRRLAAATHPPGVPPIELPWNVAELADLLPPIDSLRPAAVLVPIVMRGDEARVVLTAGPLRLDEGRLSVSRDGEPVALSPTEFTLLRYFVINAGTVLSKPKILDHVWRYDFGGDVNVVESYVSYLRRKIDTGEKRLLHTLRGVGYVLREPR